MHTSKIKKISLAVCLALLPLSIYAAGLGKLNVTSNLGEPFKAEIELLATTPEELETLVAVIASEDAYAAQGITRLGIHNDIRVEIADIKTGKPKLLLSSNQTVSDPYLDMLIQLDWASGRLQREYTVLLDPPGYKQSIKAEEIAAVNAPLTSSPESQVPVSAEVIKQSPSASTENVDVDEEIKQLKSNTKTVRAQSPAQRKTKSGDNLSKIASSMRMQGVSLDQMLAGLYEQNKEAFVGGNMNRLKVGKIIKLPSKEVLLSATKSEASKTVQLHSSDWNAYRTGLAGAAPISKNVDQASQNQSESGKIAPIDSRPQVNQTGAQDVVKLSAGDKNKTEKDAKKVEEAKKIAEQEDKVANDKALAEAENRTTAVEKQIEDMQKLLALKNKAMTDLQKKAEADKATEHPVASPVNPEVKPTEPKVEDANQEAPAVEAPKVDEPKPEETKVTPPVVQPPKEPSVEKPAIEAPGFLDSLKDSVNLSILGGLVGIILLGAGWMFLRNKRRKDLESFERGILTSGGLRANTVFGNTTGSTSVSADTSFLTDFAQSTDGTMIDTNEVDPIAEAEVYMAYGRDAQAEEILKDAISKEPKRYELHLKLLEMYAARKDTSAFEAIAGELYTTLGSDDPTWAKVVEIGKTLEPDNPLYTQNTVVEEIPVANEKVVSEVSAEYSPAFTSQSATAPDLTISDDVAQANFKVDEPNVSNLSAPNISNISRIESIVKHERADVPSAVKLSETSDDDFTLKVDTSETEASGSADLSSDNLTLEPSEDDLRIQQSFESAAVEDISFDTELELSTENQYEVTQSEMSVPDLNFDLDSEADKVTLEDSTVASQADANLKAFDLSAISLDLNESSPEVTLEQVKADAVISDDNDVEVKLNLVAAYIDMDDKEGARELLEEVMKEGSDEQVMRAQLMLDNIS